MGTRSKQMVFNSVLNFRRVVVLWTDKFKGLRGLTKTLKIIDFGKELSLVII